MIAGRDFVVFSDRWDGLPTSTSHLFQRIHRENRVFWFNITTRMPRLKWGDLLKVTTTTLRWSRQILARSRSAAAVAVAPLVLVTVHVASGAGSLAEVVAYALGRRRPGESQS